MKKRILVFSTAYLPLIGGAEIAIKEITERLADLYEFDVIVARLRKDLKKRESVGNVEVYRVGIGVPIFDKLLLPFIGALLALRLQKKHFYTGFWVVMVSFAAPAAVIARAFSRMHIPLILTLQEGDSEEHLTYRWAGLLYLWWRIVLKKTHILTAISTYLLSRARRLGFRGESHVIPNGVHVERFSRAVLPHETAALRSTWDVGTDDVVLISTSRLVKKNGLVDVIEALHGVDEHIKFVIAGEGPDAMLLKKCVRRYGVEKRVVFLGRTEPEVIPTLLKASDIFIRPSLSEGMGNSFIEAMAAGIPVIATQVGGIADFLFDPKRNPTLPPTGLAVDPHRPDQIRAAIATYLLDEDLKQSIVSNARDMAVSKYDWNLIAREMHEKVFSKL